jgi:cytochrome c nitrite reductase small subunit
MIQMTLKKYLLGGAGLVLLAVITFIPHGILFQSSQPAFCNLCHPMHEQYKVWLLTGVHRNIKCVDCHLPNNNEINHLIWKGIDGTKDLVSFLSGSYPDYITATSHAKKVIQANCVRCHADMVSRINTDDRNCWSCHRRINHRLNEFSVTDTR